MKTKSIILFALFFVAFGCDKVDKPEVINQINVEALKKALYEYNPVTYQYDSQTVYAEIKKLMTDLKANPTAEDREGHAENVNILIERLNKLDGFTANLFCYSCISTNPPKSEISIQFNYNRETVKRQMFVMPAGDNSDDLLHFAGIQNGK